MNGEYLGNYLVTEKITVGESVVDVTDLDDLNESVNPGVDPELLEKCVSVGVDYCGNMRWTDIPRSPDDITGGYLIEFDQSYYASGTNGFVTQRGQCVTVKSPSNASKQEIEYISGFCSEAEEALFSEDGTNSKGKHYTDYYDIASLAKMFILQEYLLNADVYYSSNYFSKDAGGKLIAGPAWDFDECLNPIGDEPYTQPENWCVNILNIKYMDMEAGVFEKAFRHADFRSETVRQWKKYRDSISGDAFAELVRSAAGSVKASAAADHFRWSQYISGTAKSWEDIYVGRCEKLVSMAKQRTVYLDKGFSGNAATLYYDLNGISGWMYNEKIVAVGESITVKEAGENSYEPYDPPKGYTFDGWNTAKDGGGQSYSPGEEIVLTTPSTTLYAQWKKNG